MSPRKVELFTLDIISLWYLRFSRCDFTGSYNPWESVRFLPKKGQQRYYSRVRGSGTPVGGLMKLGTLVDVPDVMNHASFHVRVNSSLGASGVSKIGFCL
jgi:hypothetical protein